MNWNVLAKMFPSSQGGGMSKRVILLALAAAVAVLGQKFGVMDHDTAIGLLQDTAIAILGKTATDFAALWKGLAK